jgi:hypothetical protein
VDTIDGQTVQKDEEDGGHRPASSSKARRAWRTQSSKTFWRGEKREANGGDGEATGGDLQLHLIISDFIRGDR